MANKASVTVATRKLYGKIQLVIDLDASYREAMGAKGNPGFSAQIAATTENGLSIGGTLNLQFRKGGAAVIANVVK